MLGRLQIHKIFLYLQRLQKRGRVEGKIDDSERLHPEEVNQQNIEALVAENNLKMEILPVNDLDVALHDFVNKDDKTAFHACLLYNLEETRCTLTRYSHFSLAQNKIAKDSDPLKFEEDDLILKVGECLEDRLKERSTRPKDTSQFTSTAPSLEGFRGKGAAGIGSAASFSDDEDTTQMTGSKSTSRGRRGSTKPSPSEVVKGKTSTRGRGRGRGRGATNLKQTTLDAALGIRHSQRSASVATSASVRSIVDDDNDVDDVDSPSSEEDINEVVNSSENEESVLGKGQKRAAPRGRDRGSTQSKRGKKTDNTPVYRMLMNKDDDDDVTKRFNKPPPRVTRNYGALRKGN